MKKSMIALWSVVAMLVVAGGWLALGGVGVVSMVYIKSWEVEAPVEKTFGFMDDFNNLVRCVPLEVKESKGKGLGQTIHVIYQGQGQPIALDYVVTDYEPNLRIVQKVGNTGLRLDGANTFLFLPDDKGGTRLVWITEGSVEVPLLLSATRAGKEKFDEFYRGYMDELARCVKTGAEK